MTLISLLMLAYGLFVLRGIMPEGYAVNIYEQLPFRLYLILLFCYFSSCILLLAYRRPIAAIILILLHITVLIIPYMLGYITMGRCGEFSCMGLIGNRGIFDPSGLSTISDLSPTGPLLVSALALVSGLGMQTLSYFLPIFFSIMFISGMFMFYRMFMSREKLVIVAFLSSFILYFGHFQFSAFPYYLSFCMVPIYLFLVWNAFSNKNRAMAASLLIMISLIPLAHPFIFVFLLCFSLIIAFSGKILQIGGDFRKVLNFNILVGNATSYSMVRKIPVFLFLAFTSGSVLFCAKYASHITQALFPDLAWRIETLSVAGIAMFPEIEPSFEFVRFFNLYYGKYYIPLIFVIVNSVIVWQNRKRFCQHFVRRYPRFLFLYISSFFLELGFLLNPFSPYPTERFANLSFIIFAQIPLLAYSLYVIFLRKGHLRGFASAVFVLCLLWTFGFFSCFSSPYTYGVSEGVSQNEVKGMQWLSGTKIASTCVIHYEDIATGSAVLSGNSNSNFNQSATIPSGASDGIIPVQKSNSEGIKYFENTRASDPFYLVVTTFSEALILKESGSDEGSVKNVFDSSESRPLRKIYDSLNIEIYEHAP